MSQGCSCGRTKEMCSCYVTARSEKSVPVLAPLVTDRRNLLVAVLQINNASTMRCLQTRNISVKIHTAAILEPIKDFLLSTTDISNVEVPLQTAVRRAAIYGQGFIKCQCSTQASFIPTL
ncbi:hypothetical protein T12_15905 [Trichinella patagoniensis]|uniref:Uncharacterized protein n=1 Tax=Trichinella patagoniensis TaxID=990121 RepID=A0A0V0ZEE3_9BILA|nr:hypothetical protein T12_15905 [Trichinella patagoniensis]